jgi:hypothetical protein
MALIDIKTKQDFNKLKREENNSHKKKLLNKINTMMLKKVYKPLIEPLTKTVEETKQTMLVLKDAPRELLTIKPAERLALDPPDSKGADSE